MKPDISEFSFGYALTSELMNRFNLHKLGAPEFPTQNAEGKTGGGFDVKLPSVPIFLQFKRSDCLIRKNAKEFLKLGLPYYRFKTRALRHSQQHNLLLALEKKYQFVFYVAPKFHKPEELNRAFASSQVMTNSAFVRPSSIGHISDLEEHSISFNSKSNKGIFRSQPMNIELEDPIKVFDVQLAELRATEATLQTRDSFYRNLGNSLINTYIGRTDKEDSEAAILLRERSQKRNSAEYAAFVASSLFDCEVLINKQSE